MANRIEVKATLQQDKGYWVARARVYDPETGKIKHRSKSTGLTVKGGNKRKAQQMIRRIAAEWEEEANAPTIREQPIFSRYYEQWIAKKEATTWGNTTKSYRGYADKHILPFFGDFDVRAVSIHLLDDYCSGKIESGMKSNSLRKHLVVIKGTLDEAMRDGVLSMNPVPLVELPRDEKFEGQSYTPEQLNQLLRGAMQAGEPICSVVLLCSCYGLRRSEACGLRWQDIDFENKTMHICNTVTQNGSLILDEEHTKTTKSNRVIALIESTIPYLEKLRQTQLDAGLTLNKVCRRPDGKSVNPGNITRQAERLMKECGLPKVRLHDLRHTAATILSTVATPKQVQEFLGHENISTTMNTYTHLLDKEREDTSLKMDELLKGISFCSEICSESPELGMT